MREMTFRATFTVTQTDGKDLDPDTVRTALEDVLDDVTGFFATDDEDREGSYDLTFGPLEDVTS